LNDRKPRRYFHRNRDTTAADDYSNSLKDARTAVHKFIKDLFAVNGGHSSVAWDRSADESETRRWIATCATLIAAMRSVPVEDRDPLHGVVYRRGESESPKRAHAVLTNLARGLALVHGRRGLNPEVLPRIAEITMSTMPAMASTIFKALVEKGGELDVEDVKRVIGADHRETARARMQYLHATPVLEFDEKGIGKRAVLRLRPDWAWCNSTEFRALLGFAQPINSQGVCDVSPPVTSGEVCADLPSPRLVERQFDEGKEMEGGPATHNPSGVTGCIEQQPEVAHVG
jgi:hypothetical protein